MAGVDGGTGVHASTTRPVMAGEIFGSIVPIQTVESPDIAGEFVNSRPSPLSLCAFAAPSSQRGSELVSRLLLGGVLISLAMHCLVPQLPFGGVASSGVGAHHGRWGRQTETHRRFVLLKPAKPDPRWFICHMPIRR